MTLNILTLFLIAQPPPELPADVALVLRKHTRAVASLGWHPKAPMLVSASWDNSLQVWKLDGDKAKECQQLPGSASGLAFAPGGKVLVSGGGDAGVHLWDLAVNPAKGRSLSGHKNRPFAAAFSPTGKMLATGCGEPTLRVWKIDGDDLEAWGILANEVSPALGVSSLSFSHDGAYLAAGHHAGKNTLRIWNVGGAFMDELAFPRTLARLVAFSPKAPLLAFANDESIRLWEIKDNKTSAKTRLAGHPQKGQAGMVKALAFAPGGKHLASSGTDRKVIVWDIETAAAAKEWRFPWEIRALAFSPDGRFLAAGDEEGTVYLLKWR